MRTPSQAIRIQPLSSRCQDLFTLRDVSSKSYLQLVILMTHIHAFLASFQGFAVWKKQRLWNEGMNWSCINVLQCSPPYMHSSNWYCSHVKCACVFRWSEVASDKKYTDTITDNCTEALLQTECYSGKPKYLENRLVTKCLSQRIHRSIIKVSWSKTLHPQPQQVIMAEMLALAAHVVAWNHNKLNVGSFFYVQLPCLTSFSHAKIS